MKKRDVGKMALKQKPSTPRKKKKNIRVFASAIFISTCNLVLLLFGLQFIKVFRIQWGFNHTLKLILKQNFYSDKQVV